MQKLIALFLCGILARHLYAMPCYVSEVDHTKNMVCFTDLATGHDWWQDGGVEKWEYHDGADIVMFDMFTQEKYDDVIIHATKFNGMNRKMKGEN